jgi:hypothetical protein
MRASLRVCILLSLVVPEVYALIVDHIAAFLFIPSLFLLPVIFVIVIVLYRVSSECIVTISGRFDIYNILNFLIIIHKCNT